jgi:hypothetical protein
MSSFQLFDHERIMNKRENRVDFNLTESGFHPPTLMELVEDCHLHRWLAYYRAA